MWQTFGPLRDRLAKVGLASPTSIPGHLFWTHPIIHEDNLEVVHAGSSTSLIRITAGAVHGDKLPPGVPAHPPDSG